MWRSENCRFNSVSDVYWLKTPTVPTVGQVARYAVSRLNGSRGEQEVRGANPGSGRALLSISISNLTVAVTESGFVSGFVSGFLVSRSLTLALHPEQETLCDEFSWYSQKYYNPFAQPPNETKRSSPHPKPYLFSKTVSHSYLQWRYYNNTYRWTTWTPHNGSTQLSSDLSLHV